MNRTRSKPPWRTSTGEGIQIVIFNGGTGISKRDRTFDVLNRKLEKPLTGFGELFRMLSYEQVGAASMLSRATAGVYRNTVVISTPGSPAAVELAWEKLIAPEIAHLGWELTVARGGPGTEQVCPGAGPVSCRTIVRFTERFEANCSNQSN